MTDIDISAPGSAARQALAADSPDEDLLTALDTIVHLAHYDALEGVTAISSERLRQVVHHGYTRTADEARDRGWLPMEGVRRVIAAYCAILDGSGDWVTALDAMRQAGALFAAETDRLSDLLQTGGVTQERQP
jgi:hypothetical protein